MQKKEWLKRSLQKLMVHTHTHTHREREKDRETETKPEELGVAGETQKEKYRGREFPLWRSG